MKTFISKSILALAILGVTGCAGDGLIHIVDNKAPSTNKMVDNAAVTLRIGDYVDARNNGNPRLLGTASLRVSGMSGNKILLDKDAANLVASNIGKQLEIAGFKIVTNESAKYELSGVIKQLRYDVNNQDEIYLEIETSIKEIASGKVIWSGSARQEEKIFAGISGSNTNDIALNLKHKLGVVAKKTSDMIAANMTIFHPAPIAAASNAPAPVMASGQLKLSGSPARAKIYVDGVYFGLLPLNSTLEVGVHDISVKLNGYKTASEKISVRTGETTELEIKLTR